MVELQLEAMNLHGVSSFPQWIFYIIYSSFMIGNQHDKL